MGPDIPAWATVLASAATTAAGAYMQQNALDEQQDAIKKRIAANESIDDTYQKKAVELVNQNAEQYKPEERQVAEQQAIDTADKSLTGELVAAREDQAAPAATTGKVSSEFTKGYTDRSAAELARSSKIANLMARMRGPTDLRANEAMTNADFAGRGGSLAADRGAMANAGTLDVQSIQPDGTQMMLGNAASGIGGSLLASGLVKKAKTAAATPKLLGDFSGDAA